ncbi:hypothetical protein GCM10008968_03920 [Bacillus horti]
MIGILISYTQEMLIFMLLLQTLYALLQLEYLSFESYIWLLVIYLVASLTLRLGEKKNIKTNHLVYILLLLMMLMGLIVNIFHFFILFIITAIPLWRLKLLHEQSFTVEAIVKRFLSFVTLLTILFLFLSIFTHAEVQSIMLPYLWVNLGLLLFGIFYYNYEKVKDSPISFWNWLKNQSFLLCLALAWAGLPIFLPYLMMGVQYVKNFIAFIVMWVLSTKPLQSFMYWLMDLDISLNNDWQSEEDSTGELEEVENILNEAFSSSSVMIVLLLIGVAFVLFCMYLIALNVWIKPRVEQKSAAGKKSTTDRAAEYMGMKNRSRKVNWAKDEVRRLYQDLLIYAQSKGVKITSSHTARTWSMGYEESKEDSALWDSIHTFYEQKRYSDQEVIKQDIEGFKKEINQAKKNLKLAKIEQSRYDRGRE